MSNSSTKSHLIRGGLLIDGVASKPQPRASVLVIGDRIAAIGAEAEARARKLPATSVVVIEA
ncbi:MAG: hypothetical protein FJX57_21160, partial [Alphaproteobacteria bacterium]|nr:hypothetical protein [Alphaproteobacteria bacterium]